MKLRPYQRRALDQLYKWFEGHAEGNPVLVLPTGAGKSVLVAEFCREALQNWPETRILMLTHSKELIDQNAAKMREIWPDAPLGVYSAGLKQRELGEPITFGGIQSLRNKGAHLGYQDIVLIDECHLCNTEESGGYRRLLKKLQEFNPYLRVVGLTATPWRLNHGLITQGKNTIFDDLLEPVKIPELVDEGFLSPLRSKLPEAQLDVTGVHRRGGDFIEAELQRAVDSPELNRRIVREVIARGEDRRHWLFFCAGIEHAENVRDCLIEHGITAATVTGQTPAAERDQIIEDFKAGKIRAVTNVLVLSTGFDFPGIDLIAMLRPTLSPVLYVQSAGRGMRLKEHAKDCLYLDFAGVVQTHGPITDVKPPATRGEGGSGVAPVKTCQSCQELVHAAVRICPGCGAEFPPPESASKKLRLCHDDIMGREPNEMHIKSWYWHVHESSNGKKMLKVRYYSLNVFQTPVEEYYTLLHEGYAGEKALRQIQEIMVGTLGLSLGQFAAQYAGMTLDQLAVTLNKAPAPLSIKYRAAGKYFRVLSKKFRPIQQEIAL